MKALRVLILAAIAVGCQAQLASPEKKELPFVPAKRWALLVGANKYEHYGELKFATNDAKELAQTLVDNFRFAKDSVRVLTDDAGPRETPTTGHIIGELAALLADKRLDKADLFVFFFAGHGVGTPKGDFLLPTDARPESAEQVGLPVKAVVEQIVKAGLKNVLIIADACRSGAANPFGEELVRLGNQANIAVLLGCKPGTRSYEYPELRHGAFAYHLLQDLKNAEMRDATSGALWASAIADKLKTEVRSYTERDYGDAAQEPVAWTEKTRDILLGAFLPKGLDQDTVKAFKEQATVLDKSLYASAITLYAGRLFDDMKYAQAVELLRTLDQVEEMSAYAQYLFGCSLLLTHRIGESGKVLQRCAETTDDPYIKNLAMVSNPSRQVPASVKLAAAEALWGLDKSPSTGDIVRGTIQELATKERQLGFLKEYLALPDLPERRKQFLTAELAKSEGRFENAINSYRMALVAEGDDPAANHILLSEVPLLELLGRNAELEPLIVQGLKDPKKAHVWRMVQARIAKEKGDYDGMIARYSEALDSEYIDPDELLILINIGGMRGVVLKDKVKVVADRHPYSWKAWLAKALSSELINGSEKIMDAVNEATKYADDELSVVAEGFTILEVMLRDGVELRTLTGEEYGRIVNTFYAALLDYASRFGQDPELWYMALNFGLNTERNYQVAKMFEGRLGPLMDAAGLNNNLRGYCMFAMMNAGNDEMVGKIMAKGGFDFPDSVTMQWLYGLYLASRGKLAVAAKVIAVAPRAGKDFENLMTAVEAWMAAEKGDKKAASTLLARIEKASEIHVTAIRGIVYAELGQMEEALPLLEQSLTNRAWAYIYVHTKAMEVLYDYYRSKGDVDGLNRIAFNCQLTQPGNPLTRDFSYGKRSDLAGYAGSSEFDVAMWNDHLETETGTLTLTVTGTGKVSGVYENAKGDVRAVAGSVDANGNVDATVRGEGNELKMTGKLAPIALYHTIEGFHTTGQILQMLDADFYRTVWVCKPKVGPGPTP